MTPDDPNAVDPTRPALPPVMPPSGRFIAQLFLVPGMIVLVAVLIILGINYLFVGGNTPQAFLAKLDSDNADIRWRGASDLAQHIKRPESKLLKADVKLALDLAERLRKALDDLEHDEQALETKIAKLPAADQQKARRKLAPQRDFVEYLTSALGDFYVPAGLNLLCEIVSREDAADIKHNIMLRRRAVWALANLGGQLQLVSHELPAETKARIIAALEQEMTDAPAPRKTWAMNALYYVDSARVPKDTPGLALVDRALSQCAKSQDRFLRQQAAYALNFWDGELVEQTLVRLAHDDGFGTVIRIEEKD